MFKKGHIPWTKGKSCSEETKRKVGDANRGKKHTAETKKKMSDAKKGSIPWNKDIKGEEFLAHFKDGKIWNTNLTKETDERLMKMSEKNKGKKRTPETCKKISESKKGSIRSEHANLKSSETMKRKYKNGYISPMKGKHQSEGAKKLISKNNPRYWKGKKLPDEHKKKLSNSRIEGLESGKIKPAYYYIRKNSPYIWKDVKFDSNEEMQCAKLLLTTPIEGVNCHISVGTYEIDFYLEDLDLFVEYHPLWSNCKETIEEYRNSRVKMLRDNNVNIDLIVFTKLCDVYDFSR